METPDGGSPQLPPDAANILAGLWQAGEAIGLLIKQAEDLGLPAPTVVNERLTWTALRGFANYTKRYAEHLAEQLQPQTSSLVVASPEEARRLLASMRRIQQEPPHGR